MPRPAVRLHHIHLRSPPTTTPRTCFPSYALASAIQKSLQQRIFAYKHAVADAHASLSPLSGLSPSPLTLLTFTPAPIYTFGRRQTALTNTEDSAHLSAPLRVNTPTFETTTAAVKAEAETTCVFRPAISHETRGGLVTYHGPGQLVLWPIFDLRSPLLACGPLTVRAYSRLLEETTIDALAAATNNVVQGLTTEDPGVWVRQYDPSDLSRGNHTKTLEDQEAQGHLQRRKIAAMGVHLRRHVTGLGVAINVRMPVDDGPGADMETHPWSRIVACGLEGKRVTSVASVLGSHPNQGGCGGNGNTTAESLGKAWAKAFAARLAENAGGGGHAGGDGQAVETDMGAVVKQVTVEEALGANWYSELELSETECWTVGEPQ